MDSEKKKESNKKETREEALLRTYSSELTSAMLHPVEIGHKFYSARFIDETTRNKVIKENDRSREVAAHIIVEALQVYIKCYRRRNELEKKFFEILEILNAYTPLDSIVESIEQEYHEDEQSPDTQIEDKTTEMRGSIPHVTASPAMLERSVVITDTVFSDPLLASLATTLQFYSNELNKSRINSNSVIDLMKSNIEIHIRKSLGDEIDFEVINRQLNDLIMNALIPVDINTWCFETLKEIQKSLAPPDETSQSSMEDEPVCELPPLFSKDTVYHASLCSLIVSLAAQNPDLSVKYQLDEYGHNFDEMSLSVASGACKILIAKQGNVVYVSLANVHQLPGFEHQSTVGMPLRYFIELLNQEKRLVFTGFGGLSALHLFNKLWHLPNFNAKMLLQNVSCIMFSPPLTTEMEGMLPEAQNCVHSYFLKDDFILKNLVNYGRMFGVLMQREESFERLIFQDHCCENTYVIKQNVDGFYCEKLESPAKELGNIHVTQDMFTKLQSLHSKQHNMQTYHLGILRGYLDKEPCYKIPKRKSRRSVPGVQSIKPSISKVEIHCQQHPDGKEFSVVFKGDNLWFCRKITVNLGQSRLLSVDISANDVAQKQIQYFHGIDKTLKIGESDHNKFVEVAVQSLFHTETKNVQMSFNVPDPISFRQSQLARQTPSQIIQLAFLSALLELAPLDQGGNSGRPSHRYQLITKFLQEAARIVPMESIFFAIADCSSTVTAEKCAQAVISSNTLIPPSKLMRIGCQRAANRFMRRFSRSRYYHRDIDVIGPYHDSYSYSHTRRLNVTDTRLDDDYFEETTVRALCTPTHDYDTHSYENAFHVHGHSNYPVSSQHFNQHDFDYTVDDTSSKKQKQLYGCNETHSHALRNELFPRSLIRTQFQQKHAVSIHTSLYRHHSVGDFLYEVSHHLQYFNTHDLICGRNIGETYPISDCLSGTRSNNVLEPLPVILLKARQKLASLCFQHKASDKKIGTTSLGNCKMLETVNKIIEDNLNPCVTMLGGFMEQQIRIPLVNNSKDTAKAFATADTSGAVGVWALFALEKDDIVNILSCRRSQSLVLQITDFIHGVLNADAARRLDIDKLSSYDGKLQFLLQGMSETVTCSSHYISYSLERELVRLCEQLEITTSTNVDEVIATWDEKFNQTALALVPISHQPLLARWLIWALNIYRLREGLAKYTTVGVIGLVNSGKSTLVKKLFQKETVVGTTQSARTTVPFIYNMDDSVEGLSIIDFPGVDDRDESIKGLAQLLVELAQVVIFVCGYERFHTVSAEEWMNTFHNELSSIPVLVCLTHADILYEDCEDDIVPICPEDKVEKTTLKFNSELQEIIGDYPLRPDCTVKFCSLVQGKRSPLNCPEARKSMRKVGIYTPEDIGQWIKGVVDNELQQPDLAERLEDFLIKTM